MTRRSASVALLIVLLLLIATASFSATCDGGATEQQMSPAPPSASQAAPAPPGGADNLAFATPQTLPVTPVHIDYHVVDPKFDPLPHARAVYGTYDGGGYQIEVPDSWNGDVVYFAHGFRGNPPELTVNSPPMREYLVAEGFAWAASSYSKNGYEPGVAARDTYALRDIFAQKIALPKHSFLYGQSMGGHVAAFSLEQYPTAYDGALSECGVVSGHEILDYFLSWGALAGYIANSDLSQTTDDAPTFTKKIYGEILPALGGASELTSSGRAFASVIERLTGGPRPYFREGFASNYNLNFTILVNAVALAGPANAAAENLTTQYAIDDGLNPTAETINREIPRIGANPAYRDATAYPEFANFSGRIQRPFLTLHGTGDLFVPIALEQSYRAIVDSAGSGDLLVQRAVRRAGHCNFSEEERKKGFDDLVAWVERGEKPRGEDLRGDLRDAGRQFTIPLQADDPGGVTP